MNANTPAGGSTANSQNQLTTKIGNAIGALFVLALAALFLYGYIPHFLFG